MYQQLRVEAQGKGFLIKVLSERCCRGLLVFILEAFEELGLDVLQARVSCSECFHLEAVGVKVRNKYIYIYIYSHTYIDTYTSACVHLFLY